MTGLHEPPPALTPAELVARLQPLREDDADQAEELADAFLAIRGVA